MHILYYAHTQAHAVCLYMYIHMYGIHKHIHGYPQTCTGQQAHITYAYIHLSVSFTSVLYYTHSVHGKIHTYTCMIHGYKHPHPHVHTHTHTHTHTHIPTHTPMHTPHTHTHTHTHSHTGKQISMTRCAGYTKTSGIVRRREIESLWPKYLSSWTLVLIYGNGKPWILLTHILASRISLVKCHMQNVKLITVG